MPLPATIRRAALLLVFLPLAACFGPAEPKWASEDHVQRALYFHDGPPKLTLFTVVNNVSGSGAHSALMVSAGHRAIFDPAGTWYHPHLPERNDVHYGMSDAVVDFYLDYHTRVTHRTVIQEVYVSQEVAELAMREIQAYGAVPKAQCSVSISRILQKLPGFESIQESWWPNETSDAFGNLPGVTTNVIYDDDEADNSGVIQAPPVLIRS